MREGVLSVMVNVCLLGGSEISVCVVRSVCR